MPAKRSFVRGSKAIHAVQRVRAGPGRHLHNVANSATPHLRVDEGRGLKRQARSSDAAFLLFVSADNPRRSATRPLQRLEFFFAGCQDSSNHTGSVSFPVSMLQL